MAVCHQDHPQPGQYSSNAATASRDHRVVRMRGNIVLALATITVPSGGDQEAEPVDARSFSLALVLMTDLLTQQMMNALILSMHLANDWINDLWLQ